MNNLQQLEAAVELANSVDHPPEPYRHRDCEQLLKANAKPHVALLHETLKDAQ